MSNYIGINHKSATLQVLAKNVGLEELPTVQREYVKMLKESTKSHYIVNKLSETNTRERPPG